MLLAGKEAVLSSRGHCQYFLVALACFTSRATYPVTMACVCVLVDTFRRFNF